MRIVQLIDSLSAGGAERMAVNYANALASEIAFSGLVATRREGVLKTDIAPDVNYFFLGKRRSIDFKSMRRFRSYCRQHQVGLIHAHGSSFFTAILLKMMLPRVGVVWHDHNGDRDNQSKWQNKILWLCSHFFDGIIVVNQRLLEWSRINLPVRKIVYLPNFTVTDTTPGTTLLHGTTGKRIVYLANLRHPKNHEMLLEVALQIKQTHPTWSFHLVGADKNDGYAKQLKAYIQAHDLQETVYLYGLRTDTGHIIGQAEIAVIASSYEGLPVSLLEYGLYAKAVVVTSVGEIPNVVHDQKNGLMVPSGNTTAFLDGLVRLIDNPILRQTYGAALKHTIDAEYAEEVVLSQYLQWMKQIC
ncbi:glycosyltransferase family 4 protein [Flavobacterium caeni]|uniref:Glycosyltransferase involved in cell wall bisynthesis n=1 Tax=Flavobacterium caeni TaxID=490189 RepID=A0A1G5FLP3_9FLAO|nr:glycosyltransferase family 4 protein [Flavobacterium caeni]SCY40123.1 Glycosyltransferase involved in cell wall bisynthesis [Flavobacterium caeni]